MQNIRIRPSLIIIFGILISAYVVNTLFVLLTLDELYDFGSFIASGQFANAGANPYSTDSPLVYGVSFPKIDHSGIAPNLNPPISALIFQSIADVDPFQSILIWRVITVLLFLVSVLLLAKHYPGDSPAPLLRFAWALALAGFWHSIQLGQLYTFALLMGVCAWILLGKNRPIPGGIFLGVLIALKPNFVFWAILLAAARNWRASLSSCITAAGISLIPLLFHGVDMYSQWLEASRVFTPDLLIFPGNSSLQGLTARFELPQLGVVLSVVLAIGILIYVFRKKPGTETINSLGMVSSLLISPIAWTGYTILTLPIFFQRERWHWTHWFAAFIFAVPFFFVLVTFLDSFFNFVVVGWLYGWGLLFILGELLLNHLDLQPRNPPFQGLAR